jgi:hypothetical protein
MQQIYHLMHVKQSWGLKGSGHRDLVRESLSAYARGGMFHVHTSERYTHGGDSQTTRPNLRRCFEDFQIYSWTVPSVDLHLLMAICRFTVAWAKCRFTVGLAKCRFTVRWAKCRFTVRWAKCRFTVRWANCKLQFAGLSVDLQFAGPSVDLQFAGPSVDLQLVGRTVENYRPRAFNVAGTAPLHI